MFNSSEKHFLELYSPEIVFLDQAEICADNEAVKWLYDVMRELNPTLEELNDVKLMQFLKSELHMRVSKTHAVISKDTQAKIITTLDSNYDSTIIEIKGYKIPMYLTYEADFCYLEVKPLNSEYEKVFIDRIPKEKDELYLFDVNIYDLICAFSKALQEDERIAYERIKVTPKEEVLNIYNRFAVSNAMKNLMK